MAKWREFENLVARIYQELLPESEVNLDDKILGHDSKTIRQIDVSIRHRLAGHKLLIIVQAKDYKKPADLPDVGEFATVIRDVRASKGIMVCNAGFTEGAANLAKDYGVDLCSAHDALSRDWKADISIPLLWIDRSPELNIWFSAYLEAGDQISKDPQDWVISSDKGTTRIDIIGTFVRNWNDGRIPKDIGSVHNIRADNEGLELLVGKDIWRPIDHLAVSYVVIQKAWIKYVQPIEYRGIRDFFTGDFRAAHLKLDLPIKRDEEWERVSDLEKLIVETKGTLITAENPVIRVEDVSSGNAYLVKID